MPSGIPTAPKPLGVSKPVVSLKFVPIRFATPAAIKVGGLVAMNNLVPLTWSINEITLTLEPAAQVVTAARLNTPFTSKPNAAVALSDDRRRLTVLPV